MEVKQLIFREVGTYNDVLLRPFDPEFTPNLADRLVEATEEGRNISAQALSDIAHDILKPTADHEGVADIPGGWGERRWAFVGEIEIRNTNFSSEVQYITGFTDGDGIHPRGNGEATIDKRMRLLIDSSFVVRYNYSGGNGRNGWVGGLVRASNVVSSRTEADFRVGDVGTVTLTPYDVIGRRIIPEDLRDLAREENFHDYRASFGNQGVKLVSRQNNMANHYLHRLLDANAASAGTIGHEDDDDDVAYYSRVQGRLKEDSLHGDAFMQAMAASTRILDERCVTYGELCAHNDHLDDRVEVYPIDPRRDIPRRRGEYMRLDGSDAVTMAAITIAQALPTTMMRYGYIQCDIEANNLRGRPEVLLPYMENLVRGMSIQDFRPELESHVLHDLFLPISLNNALPLDVSISCGLFTDVLIKINLDNRGWEEFVIPTFSSSSYSPLCSDRESRLDEIGDAVSDLYDVMNARKRTSRIITDLGDLRQSDITRHDRRLSSHDKDNSFI
ncbi:hypothetical protein ACLPJK_26240 [Pseudomonas aeruginosa]|uniref:hypothetical protein n=1 Tax=Pseudomonas aeruginosa TaxID=287 RepID=UPI003D2962BB